MKPTTKHCLLAACFAGLALSSQAHAAHHRHHHKTAENASHKAAHHQKSAEPTAEATATARHHAHKLTAHHAVRTAAAVGAGAAVAAAATHANATTPTAESTAAPQAQQPDSNTKGSNTGLPLPRFAALRADKVYLRRGPGDRYPIDWVYHRRGLPVEIEREFDVWRLIEDSDGVKGWVHQATLFGSRTFVIPGLSAQGNAPQLNEASEREGDHVGRADARVLGYVTNQNDARSQKDVALLMSRADDDSDVVAVLKPGTVGNIKACPTATQWCHVVVKGYNGWLPRRSLWGLLPGETIQSN